MHKNIENSIRDSLYRGLNSQFNHYQFHVNEESAESLLLKEQRSCYASSLIDYYGALINKYCCEYVIASHGYYDFHVTCIAAGIDSGCRGYIVAGGHRNSYEIKSKDLLDFGSEMPLVELCDQIGKIEESMDRKELYISRELLDKFGAKKSVMESFSRWQQVYFKVEWRNG